MDVHTATISAAVRDSSGNLHRWRHSVWPLYGLSVLSPPELLRRHKHEKQWTLSLINAAGDNIFPSFAEIALSGLTMFLARTVLGDAASGLMSLHWSY